MRKGKPCQRVTYLTLTPQCSPPVGVPWLRAATEYQKKARVLESRMSLSSKFNKKDKSINPQHKDYLIQGISFSRSSPNKPETIKLKKPKPSKSQRKEKHRPLSTENWKNLLLIHSNKLVLSRIANISSIKKRLRERTIEEDTVLGDRVLPNRLSIVEGYRHVTTKGIFTNSFIKESLLQRLGHKLQS